MRPIMETVSPRTGPTLEARARRASLVALLAVVADLAVYGVARLLGVSLVVPQPGDGDLARLPIGAVVAAAVVAVALGAVVLALLQHYVGAQAERAFAALVAVFVLASLTAPLGLETGSANKLALVLMHVVTGAVAAVGLTWPDRSSSNRA
jgi:hypothetical protein